MMGNIFGKMMKWGKKSWKMKKSRRKRNTEERKMGKF